ncbi:unnamed protein product [Arabis nemorensis]|uniref:Uncharacterized protein n=1 Tax=Arabis nemorensis TaxID=586526 RepID=A0A565BW58_9BRAS|nr:unnamed protein product [Arabis nemorensis]
MEDGDYPAASDTRASGSKRSFGDLEDDENNNSGSKKGKVEESGPDFVTPRENELESAKTEFNMWKSAFEKQSFIPARTSPEPGFVIDYIEQLRSSETTLKEQLEIAQMKLAIHDLKSQLKPASMQRFTTDGDPEVDSKQGSAAGPSGNVAHLEEVEVDENRCLGLDTLPNHGGNSSSPACLSASALLDELQAAKRLIAELKEVQAVNLVEMRKKQAEFMEYYAIFKSVLQKYPSLVPPSAPEDADE